MKIILKITLLFSLLNNLSMCFRIYDGNNKGNLFLYSNKRNNILNRNKYNTNKKCKSILYNKDIDNSNISSEEKEALIREQIKKEKEQYEKIKQENKDFINNNFEYISNNIPINVEKRYAYEKFKYSHELLTYIFFVINLFKHEQFKNKLYKEYLEKEALKENKNIISSHQNDKEHDISVLNNTEKNMTHIQKERNHKLISNFIHRFGDKFKFFNTPDKIQREDLANMFKMEQEDKEKFFKKIKIKNEKTNEYYFVIYYCNWKYECMALYNAFHNILNNNYNNINFYEILHKQDEEKQESELDDDEQETGSNKKGKKKKGDKYDQQEGDSDENDLSIKDIEQIKQMYIKDLQSNKVMDMESILNEEYNTNAEDNSEGNDKGKNETSGTDKEGTTPTDNTSEEKKTKTFQEIMEEEKKKLDEEFFLHGYSKYEDEEQIKKEEQLIKESKRIIKEEKLNKTRLNSKNDFNNILNDFYIYMDNYKRYYNYSNNDDNSDIINQNTNKDTEIDDQTKKKDQTKSKKKKNIHNDINVGDINISNSNHDINNQNVDDVNNNKTKVNINVIFVRISNSTVIGKTKNIKKKIKKKWIYSHEKEIKFYELILSLMLNENIYYKNIPHMDIFSLTYNKQNLFEFFNSIQTNLKHSFIHKNNVYDIYNHIHGGALDIYNFNIYDKSTYQNGVQNDDVNIQNDDMNIQNDDMNIKNDDMNIQNDDVNIQNDDVVLEELDINDEIHDMENYGVIYDKLEEDTNENDLNNNQENMYNNNMDDTVDTNPINIKKHNKKKKSKYETLFKQKYINILVNNIRNKISIEKISSISNVDNYSNYTVDTFKHISLNNIFKKNSTHEHFKIDKNYVYYLNHKIPKDIFPFILQLSLAFKYEHTHILINAPKKVEFIYRNV
ncbi:conserved Plasmodium protein, unknown function [Plasmodium gaboni]|uniref:Uncharacterized protein n=1 Tax=Plasmodium gaboni TaxID=647221 RepID=A0ABY1UTR4_9APIC|nr:conserved Plasmodium protein, unknown function [Plasmodium gaboni]